MPKGPETLSDYLVKGAVNESKRRSSLVRALDLDRVDFWGGFALGAVDRLLDDAKSQLQHRVAAKMAAARLQLNVMLRGLDPAGQRILQAALSGRAARHSIDHNEPQQCPVCNQQGWLVCYEDEEAGHRVVEQAEDGHALLLSTAYAEVFECPVCRLELERDELVELDLPDVVEFYSDLYGRSDFERAGIPWPPI